MAQRRTNSRSTSSRGRSASGSRAPSNSKYQSSSAQARSSRGGSRGRSGGGGLKVVLMVLLVAIVAGGAILVVKNLPTASTSTASANSDDTIIQGITIDGIDVAGMTKEAAYAAVEAAAQTKIDNISVSFTYNSKAWTFTADELQAAVNAQSVVDQAFEIGKTGTNKDNKEVQEQTAAEGLAYTTTISVDRQVLVDALQDVKDEIDQPMVEGTIEFDPSSYNYFEDLETDEDLSRSMFTITEGTVGYAMDYDKALQELNDALTNGWTAEIALEVVESHPTYTLEELEECTTLVIHSSSKITTSNRDNANRNSNISKAIGFFKGMVIEPGEMISYNEVLGERTEASGWLEAPTISQDKTLEDALGGGICQAATAIYNAVFMAGAKIIDRGPHSWPAYYTDYGYGMDAMVNWGTDELIFQNDSDYPMFINTYFNYDTYGRPSYVDIDVYTMPQKDEDGTILHIRAESTIVTNESPGEVIYKDATDVELSDPTWTIDSSLGLYTYTYRSSRNLVVVDVDKVWYKECIEETLGEWSGGVEVKREDDHTDTYQGVQAIVYTKPTPTPSPTPKATATPTPSPTAEAG